MKGRDFLFVALVMLLAACSTSGPFNETNAPSGEQQPVVNDPDLDINVTPQPEEEYAYFTVKVQRIGEASPAGAWLIEGEIYLKITADAEGPINVIGTGFGTGAFDGSGPGFENVSDWKVEYVAQGFFDKTKCEITLKIDETTPDQTANLTSSSVSASASGDYTKTFSNLKFKYDEPYIEIESLENPVKWTNTFLIIPREEANSTDCLFEMN